MNAALWFSNETGGRPTPWRSATGWDVGLLELLNEIMLTAPCDTSDKFANERQI